MRKRLFNSKNCSPAINKFRIAMNGENFTKDQLLSVFKESGVPTNRSFWAEFMKSGIVKKVGKHEFVFSSDQPIFHGVLDNVYRKYCSTVKNYRHHKPVLESKPEMSKPDLVALESFAIDFLKELGYKILAPVGIVYKPV